MKYLLGIDIGTSACKAAAFDQYGKVAASVTVPYQVTYPKPGYAEQSAEEWFDAVCTACNQLWQRGVNPSDIAAVGVDGQSWSAIPVDKSGRALYNTPIWFDTRSADICAEIRQNIGEDIFFECNGNPFQPTYTTPKVLWFKQNLPELLADTYKIMQSNSFIVQRLTGVFTQDLSQGYGHAFFDMKRGCYNHELCRLLGLDPTWFPEDIRQCHEVVGGVTTEAARLTGLLEGTPVVAGGLDAACGTLGTGVIYPGQTQEQGGTSGGMSICTDQCLTNRRLITSQHVVHGRWLLQGGTTGGGGTMKWWHENFGEGLSYKECDQLAAAIPPGSDGLIMLPYMAGERSPIWNPAAKGVYYGVDYTKTKAHFTRALLEGAAFALRHNLETDQRIKPDTLYATGGSANSTLWTQIKADVTGCKILVPTSDEGATLGAAILAGIGVGMYDSFEQAVDMTITIRREHSPNPANYQKYNSNYIKYLSIYESLKHLYV